jgi:hypothetical protein
VRLSFSCREDGVAEGAGGDEAGEEGVEPVHTLDQQIKPIQSHSYIFSPQVTDHTLFSQVELVWMPKFL